MRTNFSRMDIELYLKLIKKEFKKLGKGNGKREFYLKHIQKLERTLDFWR